MAWCRKTKYVGGHHVCLAERSMINGGRYKGKHPSCTARLASNHADCPTMSERDRYAVGHRTIRRRDDIKLCAVILLCINRQVLLVGRSINSWTVY